MQRHNEVNVSGLDSAVQNNVNVLFNAFKGANDYTKFKENLEKNHDANKELLTILKEKENLHGEDVIHSAYKAARTTDLNKLHPKEEVGYLRYFIEYVQELCQQFLNIPRDFITENVQHTIIDDIALSKKDSLREIRGELAKTKPDYNVSNAKNDSPAQSK